MRKLGLRAVIAGASVLTIMSAVDGADLLGQAHADTAVRRQRGRIHARKRTRPRATRPAPRPSFRDCLHWRGAEDPEELIAGKCRHPACINGRAR